MPRWIPARILDDSVPLLASASRRAEVMDHITDRPRCELIRVSDEFVELRFPDRRHGFARSKLKYFPDQELLLRDLEVLVRAQPVRDGEVVIHLVRGDTVYATDLIENDGTRWMAVIAAGTKRGFIDAKAKVLE